MHLRLQGDQNIYKNQANYNKHNAITIQSKYYGTTALIMRHTRKKFPLSKTQQQNVCVTYSLHTSMSQVYIFYF